MSSRPNRHSSKRPRRRTSRGRRGVVRVFWRFLGARWNNLQRVMKALLKSPPTARAIMISVLLLFLWLGVNWVYHAFNKPSEVLFPLDRALNKRPMETWKEYGSLFREHATPVITAELLAALAQTEGAGNPLARTYWRWHPSWNPLEWYQPASSAVGMYQITDGTFREAARYCIHDHMVVEDGPWNDVNSCWFNSLYTRVVPSHAIEVTSASLDRAVAKAIGTRLGRRITLRQKQDLAALIHLCGAGAGHAYASRGFRLTPSQRCGDHDVSSYLARVNALKYEFSKPAAGDKAIRRER